MDRPCLRGLDGADLVDRLADHVHDAAQGVVADRYGDGFAGVDDFLAAHETFRGVHGDGADSVLAKMLRHFEHETRTVVLRLQRVQDLRQVLVELHVHHGAGDLANMALGALAFGDSLLLRLRLCDHSFPCHRSVPSSD
jgi:hypothetical protein